jgi:hypothetical protein
MAILYCILTFFLGFLLGTWVFELTFNTRRERIHATLIVLEELQEFLCQLPEFVPSFDAVEVTRQLVKGMQNR